MFDQILTNLINQQSWPARLEKMAFGVVKNTNGWTDLPEGGNRGLDCFHVLVCVLNGQMKLLSYEIIFLKILINSCLEWLAVLNFWLP